MSNGEGHETAREQGARYKASYQRQVGMRLLRLVGVLAILSAAVLLLRHGSV
jgi:hypothetical protein